MVLPRAFLKLKVQRYRANTISAGRHRSSKAVGALPEGSTDATRRNMRQRKATAYPHVGAFVQPGPDSTFARHTTCHENEPPSVLSQGYELTHERCLCGRDRCL